MNPFLNDNLEVGLLDSPIAPDGLAARNLRGRRPQNRRHGLRRNLALWGALGVAAMLSGAAQAADIVKANNSDDLTASSSWVGGVVPGAGDVAVFNNTVTTAISVRASVGSTNSTWQGIRITNPGGNITLNGNSSGAGTLTIGAAGIDMSAATVDLTTNIASVRTATSASQSYNVAAGRTLTFNSGLSAQGGTTTITNNGAGTTVANGVVGNGSGVIVLTQNNAAGLLVLAGANTYTGATNITAGAVRADSTNALQTSTVTVTAANGLTFGSGVTSALLGSLAGAGSFPLANTAAGAVNLQVGNTNASTAYTGTMSGSGSLTKIGTGTQTVSANTYSGGTSVRAGSLQLASGGNTSANLGTGTLNLQNGGRVRLNSTSTTTFDLPLDLGTGGGTLSFRGNTSFNASNLTGTGPLTLDIDNGITLTPISFFGFGGAIGVSSTGAAATFRLAANFDNTSLRNAALNLGAGISLTRNAGTNGAATTDIGTLTGAATSNLGGSAAGSGTYTFSIGARNEDATFAGATNDGGTKTALTKVGTGAQTLSGLGNFTGPFNLNAGSVLAAAANNSANPTSSSLGNPQSATHTLNINNAGTLQFAAGDVLGGATSTIVSPLVINAGGTVTNNGAVFNSLGPVTLNGGTLTGTGGSGNTQFQMYRLGGAVTVGGTAASTISVTGAGNATSGYHLDANTQFNIADVTGNASADLIVSASLIDQTATSGAGSFTKLGVGTLTLSGANTYTGTTSVSAGILLLGASERIADASGLALSGTSTFASGGFNETLAALSLADNSTATLDLGAGASIVKFTALGTGVGTLSITNYSGSASGGGTDQLFIGTSNTLTSAQLAQISFVDVNGTPGTTGAAQLTTGEVVPLAAAVTDVSPSIAVYRSAASRNRLTGRYKETIILKNNSTGTINGPFYLVLDGLTSNATLFNASGTTSTAPAGRPYFTVSIPNLPAGATQVVVLEFTVTNNTAYSFTTRVLAGSAAP